MIRILPICYMYYSPAHAIVRILSIVEQNWVVDIKKEMYLLK